MRPIVVAKLLGLTLFGLYLVLGFFAHATGEGSSSNSSMVHGPGHPISTDAEADLCSASAAFSTDPCSCRC